MRIYDKGVIRVLDPSDKEDCARFLADCNWEKCWRYSDGSLACVRWEKESWDTIGTDAFLCQPSDDLFPSGWHDALNEEGIRRALEKAQREKQTIILHPRLPYMWAKCLLDIAGPYEIEMSDDCLLHFGKEAEMPFTFLRYLVPQTYWWATLAVPADNLVKAGSLISRLLQWYWLKVVVIYRDVDEILLMALSTSPDMMASLEGLKHHRTEPVVVVWTDKDLILLKKQIPFGLAYLPRPGKIVVIASPSYVSEAMLSQFSADSVF